MIYSPQNPLLSTWHPHKLLTLINTMREWWGKTNVRQTSDALLTQNIGKQLRIFAWWYYTEVLMHYGFLLAPRKWIISFTKSIKDVTTNQYITIFISIIHRADALAFRDVLLSFIWSNNPSSDVMGCLQWGWWIMIKQLDFGFINGQLKN